MAPTAHKPGVPAPKSSAARKSAVRRAHDRVAASNGRGSSASSNGQETPTADRARANSQATKGESAATGVAGKVGNLLTPTSPVGAARNKTLVSLARRSARRAAGTLASKAIPAGAHTARKVAVWAGESSGEAIKARARRLPIQRAVDVAVPLEVAWDQWMQFNYFPEGAHRVKDVQRDGDRLVGRVARPVAEEWEAEIIDERVDESFAWQSIDGSDCAGLVTFHRLSDRLTRIELNLDVRPVGLAEALTLTLHLADRRAEADLRRFKAHVELLNPDTYQEIVEQADPEREGR